MNRYIAFTDNTIKVIDECFLLAVDIWGGKYDDVRILVGNYSGYGKYVARYEGSSKIIEFPLNSSFSSLYISKKGVEIIDGYEGAFKGTLLHELAHHYVKCNTIKLDFEAGQSTHTNKEWCFICSTGWKYFMPALDVTPELLARGIRTNVEELAHYLSSFSPYEPPIDIIENISRIDVHEKYCSNCDELFISKRTDTKYCSNKCRMKAHRLAKKEKEDLLKHLLYDFVLLRQDKNETNLRLIL